METHRESQNKTRIHIDKRFHRAIWEGVCYLTFVSDKIS